MTDYVIGIKSLGDVVASSVLYHDARALQRAKRKSVSTSPSAFLSTVTDINAKSIDHWVNEIRSSFWAVVQRNEEVLGIAAAKQPDREKDKNLNLSTSRFIESVWIDESIRGRGIGRRLVEYLMHAENERNNIQQFFLWVLDQNHPAVRLYERIGFKPTGEEKWHPRVNATEIQYQLLFDSAQLLAPESGANAAARKKDWCSCGVRYRVLGE